jgi:hypothetical protein
MSVDILRRLPTETLRAEKDKAEQSGNKTFASQLGAALEAKGITEGTPVPGMPGLREIVEPPSRENGGRFVTRFEGDMMAWLAPLMTDGTRCKINKGMALEARRQFEGK